MRPDSGYFATRHLQQGQSVVMAPNRVINILGTQFYANDIRAVSVQTRLEDSSVKVYLHSRVGARGNDYILLRADNNEMAQEEANRANQEMWEWYRVLDKEHPKVVTAYGSGSTIPP